MLEASAPCCRSSSFPSFLLISPISKNSENSSIFGIYEKKSKSYCHHTLTDGFQQQNLFFFFLFSFDFQSSEEYPNPFISPIIIHYLRSLYSFLFSSEKAMGKRKERRGWIWPLCLENRAFPVYVSFSFLSFFCIFSV